MNQVITPKGESGSVKTASRSKKAGTSTAAPAGGQAAERIEAKRGVKDAMEFVMRALFLFCGLVAVAFVLVISVYLIISGIPAIREVGFFEFLGGTNWDPANKSGNPAYGLLPMTMAPAVP